MSADQFLLPFEKDPEPIRQEMAEYYRHLNGDYKYKISIEPMPTPRPRFRVMTSKAGDQFVHTYNPPEYTKYKEELVWLMKDAKLGLRKADYGKAYLEFGVSMNMTETKSKLADKTPHRKKFDLDNLCKAFFDGLQQAGIIEDDRIIHGACARKVLTTGTGYISFNLA